MQERQGKKSGGRIAAALEKESLRLGVTRLRSTPYLRKGYSALH